MKEKAINIIKEELNKNGIEVKKIILFGSRARNDYKDDSDRDFLIVIDKEINREEKWRIILKIKRKLSALNISNDIIINSEQQIQERKDNVGYITYYALKEGYEI
jgi:predicted nucleotidyltransferase